MSNIKLGNKVYSGVDTLKAKNADNESEYISFKNDYIEEVATAEEMAQYLTSKYYGAVVKYTGTTGIYTNGRLYKVIQATSNEYTFDELITPVGSITKTENGTYNVKEYAEVVVNVSQTGGGDNKLPQVIDGTITELTAADLAGATKIRSGAFSGLNMLTSVTIPDSVTSIDSGAFDGCPSLTGITISGSVTSIGSFAFYNCMALTSVTIGNGVKVIDIYAFANCSALTSITIPDSVTSIGDSALSIGSSTHKATITMESTTPPSIQSDTFNASYLNKIVVPVGTAATYKAATNWSNFADYIEEAVLPRLATPQNVTANGTTVSWDEVENATSYEVLMDGDSIMTVENE